MEGVTTGGIVAQAKCRKLTKSDLEWAIVQLLAGPLATSGQGASEIVYRVDAFAFMVPPYDEISLTYYGATNNIDVQTFKRGGVTVAVLKYTYVASGAADNDRISNIKRTS